MCVTTHLHVWHDSHIWVKAPRSFATAESAHSDVWRDFCLCVMWLVICVTWLIQWKRLAFLQQLQVLVYMCDVTPLYLWHDSYLYEWEHLIPFCSSCKCSFIRVAWLIHMCDVTHHMCAMTHTVKAPRFWAAAASAHSHVWQNSVIRVPRLIQCEPLVLLQQLQVRQSRAARMRVKKGFPEIIPTYDVYKDIRTYIIYSFVFIFVFLYV